MAEKIIDVFPLGRRAVFYLVPFGNSRQDGLGRQPAGAVVVQMKIEGFYMGMILQKPGEGGGQFAFLDLFLRLVNPGQG